MQQRRIIIRINVDETNAGQQHSLATIQTMLRTLFPDHIFTLISSDTDGLFASDDNTEAVTSLAFGK